MLGRGRRRAAPPDRFSPGGTLNDLLLCDLFAVLRQWNVRYGSPDNRCLRIIMPATLRTREDALRRPPML